MATPDGWRAHAETAMRREVRVGRIEQLTTTPAPLTVGRPLFEQSALNAAYRERNAVVAALIRVHEGVARLVPAPDAPGWWIVYLETGEVGQLSWHVAAADLDLFDDVLRADTYPWDGHTTEEKYERLRGLG